MPENPQDRRQFPRLSATLEARLEFSVLLREAENSDSGIQHLRACAGHTVNISAQATDNVAVANVSVHILGPSFDANLTMTRLGPSSFYLSRAFMNPGTYAYTVWARDATGNVQSRQGSFEIAVQPPPGVDSVTWLLVGGLIAAAALAIGVFFWRRGRLQRRDPPR